SLGVPPSPELIETNGLLDLVEDRPVTVPSC
ncbi:MAG: hypothetical protein QOF11_159, partial [Chloroflexota bacterium]|nr:hypothetical protein [Chloroflexota bacterium]